MRRPLAVLLLALLLAGCAKPVPTPAPQPDPAKVISPRPESAPTAKPNPAPTISDLQAQLSKADALLVASRNREAVTLLIELVGAQPESTGAWDLLTLALVRLGAPKAAIMTGSRAVRLQPESATIRFNLGLAYYRAHLWSSAIPHLQEAVRLNPVSPDPQLFLARAEAGMALAKQDQPALTALRSRFPKDPEIERFQAALDMRKGDLDGDGVPERVERSADQITVKSGRDGTVYLSHSITLRPSQEDPWKFGLLDDGINRFFLLNLPPGGSLLWRFENQRLIRVETDIGTDAEFRSGPDGWELLGRFPNGANTYYNRYIWLEGRLLNLGRLRIYPLAQPLMDATDLFLAVSQEALTERAFASASIRAQVPDPKVADWQAFLLPQTDGSYRLELWEEGKLTHAAKAAVNKQWQIDKLDWE